ncbi:hypothetical protein WN55_03486 [Dufourea novaeangliae]|uniref:Uncharacterized protein n=1 Tax=Dufourea novaeangliae TaxID=178035 RepID=A0A154PJC4_DUFNO|nr:hypothetical protein WN55_03486 [Dufourea novaeangliae]
MYEELHLADQNNSFFSLATILRLMNPIPYYAYIPPRPTTPPGYVVLSKNSLLALADERSANRLTARPSRV